MLILSRKPEETLTIGDSIQIKIVGVRGNKVKIGIEAPDDVRVMRSELLEKKLPARTVPPSSAVVDDIRVAS